jgi:hypothetical protein
LIWSFTATTTSWKYDLLVSPGADPQRIKLAVLVHEPGDQMGAALPLLLQFAAMEIRHAAICPPT